MRVVPLVLLIPVVPACRASSPTQPSGAVTTGAPKTVEPAPGAKVNNSAQPVTLVVSNGMATGTCAVTYTFGVATDPGFANQVVTKDGVAQAANGQASVTLGTLTANADCYWDARVVSGGNTGVYRLGAAIDGRF
jgi:hypothetical protein